MSSLVRYGRIELEDWLNDNLSVDDPATVGCGGRYLDLLSRHDTEHTGLATIAAQLYTSGHRSLTVHKVE